jgi:ABC-2 type transport system permease protein
MLRIIQRLWLVNWAEHWQYRANLMMFVVYGVISPLVYLSVWTSIANANGSVNGLAANDFITYYLVLIIVYNITGDLTEYYLTDKIQDGTLSNELLRPIHPVLTQVLIATTAQKVLSFVALGPAWVILVLLFRPDFSGVTPGSILLAILGALLGATIAFVMGATITCLAFWITRMSAIYDLYTAIMFLFAGQFVPLPLMPPAIQTAARYLPFQMLMYSPIEILLNHLSPGQIQESFLVSLAWLVILVLIFNRAWRAGLRHFTAVGS